METPTFLYKPNFCAECGEKVERESWHFWASRRFCDNCEPVFRLNRILPPALFGVLLFFAGMFLGQSGQPYQKGIPFRSTVNSLKPEKTQTIAPKQLPSPEQSSQRLDPAANQSPPGNLPPPAAPKPAPAGNLKVQQVPPETYICGARTKKGTPCSRRVKAPDLRCWQHLGKAAMNREW